ncbi:MAG: hypothetical protein RR448_02870 [Niameybacter sp.]
MRGRRRGDKVMIQVGELYFTYKKSQVETLKGYIKIQWIAKYF